MHRVFVVFAFFASILLFQSTFAQEERAENPADLLIGRVEVFVDEATLQLGQSTRLICIAKFKKRPSGDINSLWRKSAFDEDINKTDSTPLSLSRSIINTFYMNRYKVYMTEENENNMYIRNYTLTIANASVADSGLYLCTHGIDGTYLSGNHSILVNKAIGTSWNTTGYDNSLNRSLIEEGVLRAKESDKFDLECTARHTSNLHKYNRVDVYISGTKESKQTNISRLFIRTNTSRSSTDENFIKTAADNEKSKSEPLIQLYDISLRQKDFKFNYTHNGQFLHCYSANDKSGAGSKDAVIRLNITHRPAFKCDHIQKASLYASNTGIKCRVYANPMDVGKMYWEFKYGGVNTRLYPGKSKGERDYRITAGAKKKTNEYVEFTLQFSKIRKEYFKEYKLVAKNSVGDRSVKIQLRQKSGPRSAAPQITAQFSLLSILFVVVRAFSKA